MPGSLHLHNARIWTGDPARPWGHALTIEIGRITALDQPAAAAETAIDARGRVVTPGLIDAHMHLLQGGRSLSELDLSGVRSRAAFEAAIAARHAQLPPGEWLLAGGWSQENWGGELPDKSWLRAAGDRPVVCTRMDMHAAVVNDAVLRLCDLEKGPGTFSGGRIVRDARSGALSGLMIEAAAWQIVNPIVPKLSIEERRRDLLAAQRHAHRFGLTAVGSMELARDVNEVFAPLASAGLLTLRCSVTLLDREVGSWFVVRSSLMESRAQRTTNHEPRTTNNTCLAVIGCKAFIDGTLGSRTARMLQDYADDPGNRGMLVELAADVRDGGSGGTRLREWIRAVAAAGLSPSMHAIGDEAARIALDAIESLDDATRQRVRPRIEHAQQIDPADFPRFAAAGAAGSAGGGVIASMQPLHKADDARYVRRRLGDDRLAGTFAFRSLLNSGARLAFGSDWPVVSCDPLLGIRTAVTGLTFDDEVFAPEQNLSVEEALRAYTVDAAFALGMDDAGKLQRGEAGDFVMFDRDPFTADWRDAPPKVIMTVVGGEVVHGAEEAECESSAREAASGSYTSR